MPGGLAHVYKLLLRTMFGPTYNMETGGILLDFADAAEPVLFFCRLALFVFDEEARRQVFASKGSSGTIFCTDCQNACNHEARLLAHSRLLRPSTCLELDQYPTALPRGFPFFARLLAFMPPFIFQSFFFPFLARLLALRLFFFVRS